MTYYHIMSKKNQKIIKKENNEIIGADQDTKNEVRKIVRTFIPNDPESTIEKLAEETFRATINAHWEELPKELREQYKSLKQSEKVEFNVEEWSKAGIALGLETHIPVTETIRYKYRPFVIEMIRNIEREHCCKTTIEKALAETIASEYARTIQYSSKLNELAYGDVGYLYPAKISFFSMLSKEADRAHRRFISALLTLKQIKSPSLELNIKANTTFIARNQQINAVDNQNKQSEINDRQ